MSLTFALVLLMTSILVFFSQEFGGFYKKIIAIPGVKLLVPLFLVSWLIESHEAFTLWLLLKGKEGYHQLVYSVSNIVSFNAYSIHIILLFLFSFVPVALLRAWEVHKKVPETKSITWRIGFIIWVVVAITLTIYQPWPLS